MDLTSRGHSFEALLSLAARQRGMSEGKGSRGAEAGLKPKVLNHEQLLGRSLRGTAAPDDSPHRSGLLPARPRPRIRRRRPIPGPHSAYIRNLKLAIFFGKLKYG